MTDVTGMVAAGNVANGGGKKNGSQDVLALARSRMNMAIGALSESRENEIDDLRFYAGSPDNQWQWPADVLATRGAVQGQTINSRPCLTINKLPQHVHQVTNDMRAIADKQNEAARTERKEVLESLFRTYTSTTTKQADRDKAFVKIQEMTRETVTIQPMEVEVVQVGSGGILNRWFGWRPESVLEAKAIAWPVLSMIGKAIAVSLGFAFWPSAERWRSQLPKASKFPNGLETERKLTKTDAREDLIRMAAAGASVESGRELADRWGVTESCASKWLRDFRREGLIKRERRGKFMAVTVPVHINGNGRAHPA